MLKELLAGRVTDVNAGPIAVGTTTWQESLPVLIGLGVTLREVRASDAASLFTLLTTNEVTRFITPPPTSLEGFERFVAWGHSQRAAGNYACFAVTLKGFDTAIGIFQIRRFECDPSTAEWGFVLGSAFWGSGVFHQGAELLIEFAFEIMGVNRLEARASVHNGRGIGALHKVGAVEEGLLRKSFLRNGEYVDQFLFAILRDDWRGVHFAHRAYQPNVH
jgi:ribosomal-protein-alanine N-acetyltransferase